VGGVQEGRGKKGGEKEGVSEGGQYGGQKGLGGFGRCCVISSLILCTQSPGARVLSITYTLGEKQRPSSRDKWHCASVPHSASGLHYKSVNL
jgi:hypothetical protein